MAAKGYEYSKLVLEDHNIEPDNEEKRLDNGSQDHHEDVPLEDAVPSDSHSPRSLLLQPSKHKPDRTVSRRLFTIAEIGKEFAIQTWRQIKKSKTSYCLGFMACLVVVLVVAVLLTILGNSPVVFLRLSELMSGEMDVRVFPQGPHQLNYTLFSKVLADVDSKFVQNLDDGTITDPHDFYTYHSPRYTGSFGIYNELDCHQEWDYNLKQNATKCTSIVERRAYTYGIDTEKERRMGLGRDWDLEPLDVGEVYISSQFGEDLKVVDGMRVVLRVSVGEFLGVMWDYASKDQFDYLPTDGIFIPVKVKKVFSDPKGKYPTRWKRMMLMEYSKIMPWILFHIKPYITATQMQRLLSLDIYEFADEIGVNLAPKYRLPFYVDSNFDAVQSRITHFASNLKYIVGFNQVRSSLPILSYLSRFNILSLFLGLIVNVIIFILLFICTLLIYSLLITNVETRTFEIGIFRMFGMKRIEVISLLMFQAVSYSVLSYPLGLAAAQGLANYLSTVFGTLVGVAIDPWLTTNAIVVAGLLGFLMPIIASIFPIRNALGHNLSEALDTRQSKTKAVKISISRSEDESVSWSVIIMGLSFATFGFSIYYLMPLSLLSFNLELILYLFVFLLLCMLVGATLLTLNLNNTLEKVLVYLLFFWDYRAVRSLVLKNFVAHRVRNQKTTILYAVSLAFIVFISVSYEIQIRTFLYQQEQESGCKLKVTTSGSNPWTDSGNKIANTDVLEAYAKVNPNIENFGWITHTMNVVPHYGRTRITNIGHVFADSVHVYAVSPNLFDAALSDFLTVGSYDSSIYDNVGVLESLYTLKGSESAIVGEAYRSSIGIESGHHMIMEISKTITVEETSNVIDTITGNNEAPVVPGQKTDDLPLKDVLSVQKKRMLAAATLSSAPAFIFSPFPNVVGQDALISFTTFLRLTNGSVGGVDDIPMRDFIIKLKDGVSDDEIDDIKKNLEAVVATDSGVYVWDYRDELETIDKASALLSYFFNFTTIVAMTVCFFSLNSSMYTNIYEQTKEIGILRSIGVSKFSMYRVYVYEAMVVVLSSSLLGAMIGCFVGYTMVLQRVLFTQLPIPFVFPVGIIEVVAGCSFVFAMISSFGPIRHLLQNSVVVVMRML